VDISLARDLVLKNNIVIHPYEGRALRRETKWTDLPAFALEHVHGARIENNLVIRRDSGAAIVSEESCEAIIKSGNRMRTDSAGRLPALVRSLTLSHKHDARTIIGKVLAEAEILLESAEKVQPPRIQEPASIDFRINK
jgi:hypothetical protein